MVINQWRFLTCHTHCDTGHPFMMVIPKDPWHLHLLPTAWQWSCHYLFLTTLLDLLQLGIEPRSPTCEDFRFKEALGFADITTWFSIKGFTYCIIYKVLCTAYIFRIHGEFLGTPLKYIFKVMSFICLWLPWFPLFNIIISQTF